MNFLSKIRYNPFWCIYSSLSSISTTISRRGLLKSIFRCIISRKGGAYCFNCRRRISGAWLMCWQFQLIKLLFDLLMPLQFTWAQKSGGTSPSSTILLGFRRLWQYLPSFSLSTGSMMPKIKQHQFGWQSMAALWPFGRPMCSKNGRGGSRKWGLPGTCIILSNRRGKEQSIQEILL